MILLRKAHLYVVQQLSRLAFVKAQSTPRNLTRLQNYLAEFDTSKACTRKDTTIYGCTLSSGNPRFEETVRKNQRIADRYF